MKKIFLVFLILIFSTMIVDAIDFYSEEFTFKKDNEGTFLIIGVPIRIEYRSTAMNTIYSTSLYCILKDSFRKNSSSYTIITPLNINGPVYTLRFFSIGRKNQYISYQTHIGFNGILKINKDEIAGYQGYMWFMDYFKNIKDKFVSTDDKMVLSQLSRYHYMDQKISKDSALEKAQKAGLCYILDYDEFQRIEKLSKERPQNSFPRYQGHHRAPLKPGVEEHLKKLLVESSQPITTDTPIDANIPILLIDEKNHTQRTDSQDWRIYTFLNKGNGMFYQYATFEKELEYRYPLHVRDFAMDHLAGVHLCKKSTVLIKNKTHEKVVKKVNGFFDPKNIYIHKQNGKQWKPAPVPKDKNTIPKDRLYFYAHEGRLFGSQSKIWDLNVWQMLPNLLRDNPEGVYLVGYGALLHLNECKTYHEEQELLQKTGVLITPAIYKELMALKREEALNPPPVKPIPIYVDPRTPSSRKYK